MTIAIHSESGALCADPVAHFGADWQRSRALLVYTDTPKGHREYAKELRERAAIVGGANGARLRKIAASIEEAL